MKLKFIVGAFFLITGLFAQENKTKGVIFTEDYSPFYLIVDGVVENNTASNHLKINSLTHGDHQLRVVFQDPGKGQVIKTVFFQYGMKTTYVVVNVKGEYQIRFRNQKELIEAKPSNNYSQVQTYPKSIGCSSPTLSDLDMAEIREIFKQKPIAEKMLYSKAVIHNNCMQAIQVVEIMTWLRTEKDLYEIAAYSFDYMFDIEHYRLVIDQLQNASNRKDLFEYIRDKKGYEVPVLTPDEIVQQEIVEPIHKPIASSQKICATDIDVQNIIGAISKQTFSDGKKIVAKEAVRLSCFTTIQMKSIVAIFTYEEDKLEMAKYGYEYINDKRDFYRMYEVFTFSNSVDELKKYVNP